MTEEEQQDEQFLNELFSDPRNERLAENVTRTLNWLGKVQEKLNRLQAHALVLKDRLDAVSEEVWFGKARGRTEELMDLYEKEAEGILQEVDEFTIELDMTCDELHTNEQK